MLNFLGVEFDQSEDEEVSVTDTTHLRAKDLDFRVESFGGGIGRTTAEVVQDSWSVVLECLDDRAEIVVTQCHYLLIPLVHPPHGFCRRDFSIENLAQLHSKAVCSLQYWGVKPKTRCIC